MTGTDSLGQIAVELAKLLEPLRQELAPERAKGFFGELGITVTDSQAAALGGELNGAIAAIERLLEQIPAVLAALAAEDWGTAIQQGLAATGSVGQIITSMDRIATAAQGAGIPDAGSIAERMFHAMLVRYLDGARGLNDSLEFFGLLDRQPSGPEPDAFEVARYDFGAIGDWLSGPGAKAESLYGWGAGFDGQLLFPRLAKLLGMLGLPVIYDAGPAPKRLDAVFLEAVPTTSGPPGLVIKLVQDLETGPQTVPLASEATLEVEADFQPPVGTRLTILTDGTVTFTPPNPAPLTGRIGARLLVRRPGPPQPYVVFGVAGGNRLEVGEFILGAAASVRAGEPGDLDISAQINDGKVVIDTSGADGFVSKILPGTRIEAGFSLVVGVARDSGFYIRGSSALEIRLPLHLQLGPVAVEALTLAAALAGGRVPLSVGADIRATLGPVQAVVQNIGVTATLEFPPDNHGNLGPVQLSIGFKPPTGAGLTIDAGIVAGGGFLSYDPSRGEYAGALELEFAEFLTLKGIGLITTRMPDGSPGFSLLIILTAEFAGGGIQLGYGFRLLAVGGLIGLNRAMRLQALVDGVRTGAIESVMFPRDVVANAPRILSDLRAFFPPEEGKFLVGPMAKLGWGTPTLVSVAIGIIIEIPGNIAIVGVAKVALPSEDEVLLLLQVNFVGAIEFDNQRIWFFASLFDSRVLFITIGGEMGLLVAWGDNPNFVVSVGGFHPSFSPPPLPFPNPRRITVDILNQPGARITVSGYFAVTSNTAQFGARAELHLGFSDFGISGHVAFDALFQFSPFAFIIQISASVSLRAFGVGLLSVDLRFALSGPTPWRAKGRGSISLLFFEISADFDITWGDDRDTTLPPVEVMPLIAAELEKIEGWQTVSPTGGRPLVSLRLLGETDDLVLHPLGTLFVRQRAIPLDLRLDRIGAQRPSDANRLHVEVAGGGLVKRSDPDEMFALAQFQDMDDAAKLSRPAFERQHGGVELAVDGAAMASRRAVRRSARYEQIIIDTANRRRPRRFTTYNTVLFTHFLDGNAVSRSPLSQAQLGLRQPFADTIRVTGGGYAVATTRDNTATATFASHAAAADHLRAQVDADPALAGTLHVIPTAEVRA